jgi:hypothetical protein
MPYAGLYLAERFLFRIVDFFHHWYIDASRVFFHRFVSILEDLDYTFAVHITLRHFFEPLYKDYSIIGRIMGVVFRSLRVIIGGAIYLLIAILFLCAYVAWLSLPLTIVFMTYAHFAEKSLPY